MGIQGDIVGVAASAIPTSVDFAGTEKATAYFLNGDTEVGYQLNGGDVDGSINSGVLTATISNFSSQTAETYNGTDDTPFQDDAITATINSTISGATDCGAANLFCGGVITVTVDGSNAASINASETEAVIGVYGTDGAYELGGRINADDGNTNDSFSSSFIATQQ